MITANDIVAIDVPEDAQLKALVARIAGDHADTWQKSRTTNEKVNDILIGKVGERAIEYYLRSRGIGWVGWDNLRADGFREHAPLDGFFARADMAAYIRSQQFADGARRNQQNTSFPPGILDKWLEVGVCGYEVKCSRVCERHLTNGQVDHNKLLGDRFLQYPRKRAGALTSDLKAELLMPGNRKQASERTPPYLFQTHAQELGAGQGWRVYMSGYILSSHFYWADDLAVTRLTKLGKSEQAIYYALPLRKGKPLSTLSAFSATIN
jgi:hypothetical protein